MIPVGTTVKVWSAAREFVSANERTGPEEAWDTSVTPMVREGAEAPFDALLTTITEVLLPTLGLPDWFTTMDELGPKDAAEVTAGVDETPLFDRISL